jgi:hypothetical protein
MWEFIWNYVEADKIYDGGCMCLHFFLYVFNESIISLLIHVGHVFMTDATSIFVDSHQVIYIDLLGTVLSRCHQWICLSNDVTYEDGLFGCSIDNSAFVSPSL